MREQGAEDTRSHPTSHLASHGVKRKVRYTEGRKIKTQREKVDELM